MRYSDRNRCWVILLSSADIVQIPVIPFDTKKEALARVQVLAQKRVKSGEDVQVVVYGKDGKAQSERTYRCAWGK